MRNILRLIEGKKSKIKGMWMYKKYIREQSIKNSIKLFNLNLILKNNFRRLACSEMFEDIEKDRDLSVKLFTIKL